MPKINHQHTSSRKRQMRIRGKLHGTTARPRLSVYRSNQHTFLQVIDDEKMVTVASAHDTHVKKSGLTKIERAVAAAELLAGKLEKIGVKALVFDRGMYRYHGRVKAVADAMRSAGVEV